MLFSPLFFVRGGYIYPNGSNSFFAGAGQNGGCWSSRALPGSAYFFNLNNNKVDPSASYYSNDGGRYVGYPLRCLIPTP